MKCSHLTNSNGQCDYCGYVDNTITDPCPCDCHKNIEIERYFNGKVYLVRHNDISDQFIGSGYTEREALEDAEKTRAKIIAAKRAVQP